MKAEFSCQSWLPNSRPVCSARPQSIRPSGEEGSPPRAPPRYATPAAEGWITFTSATWAQSWVRIKTGVDNSRRRMDFAFPHLTGRMVYFKHMLAHTMGL